MNRTVIGIATAAAAAGIALTGCDNHSVARFHQSQAGNRCAQATENLIEGWQADNEKNPDATFASAFQALDSLPSPRACENLTAEQLNNVVFSLPFTKDLAKSFGLSATELKAFKLQSAREAAKIDLEKAKADRDNQNRPTND
jgi:hypothetical protein